MKQLKAIRLIGDGGTFTRQYLCDMATSLQQLTTVDLSCNSQGLSITSLPTLASLSCLKTLNLTGLTFRLDELAMVEHMPVQISAMILQLLEESDIMQAAAWLKRQSKTLQQLTIGAPSNCASFAASLFGELASAKGLQGLQLSKMDITGKIGSIIGLSELTYIRFSECRGLNDSSIDMLAALPKLKLLTLSNNPGVTTGAQGVKRIAASIPQLDRIHVNKVTWEKQ
jgi:hypothetical protein